MPIIKIKRGETLSKIAQRYGTTVGELMTANKTNPAVKSKDIIIADGDLTVPEKAGEAPTTPAEETSAGDISQEARLGSLIDYKDTLKAAIDEASQERMKERATQITGVAGGVPGTIGQIAGIVREQVSSASELQKAEKAFELALQDLESERERLRDEGKAPEVFGSDKFGYFQWDKDSRSWQPISAMAATSFDSGLSDDSWVKLILAGHSTDSDIKNSEQLSRVRQLIADQIPDPTNKEWVKDGIEEERALGRSDEEIRKKMKKLKVPESLIEELLPEEKRGLFGEKISITPSGRKIVTTSESDLFTSRGGAMSRQARPSPFGTGDFVSIHIDDRVSQLMQTLIETSPTWETKTGIEKRAFIKEQLTQNGYHPDQIKAKLEQKIL